MTHDQVMETTRGRLLVANGSLLDPNFRRAVILVADHDEDGAAGVVLNRRSETTVAEAAPPLAPLAGSDELVYVGGPVQPEAAVVLADYAHPELAEHLVLAYALVGGAIILVCFGFVLLNPELKTPLNPPVPLVTVRCLARQGPTAPASRTGNLTGRGVVLQPRFNPSPMASSASWPPVSHRADTEDFSICDCRFAIDQQ